MNWSLSLLMAAGLAGANVPGQQASFYDSYTKAYRAAQETQRPMLVILNPPQTAARPRVLTAELTRSNHRRELLLDYVVVTVDAGTEHGQKVHQLFGSGPLPRVVVIDKQQERQIFRTSQPMSYEQWNVLLENYRNGVAPAPAQPTPFYCPSCR